MKTKLHLSQLLVLIFSMLAGTIASYSQTTKTTKADGFWSDPDTWTGGVIPDASNKATINNDVIIDMDVTILSLTVSAASSLTFDTTKVISFTVNDELIVNGLFTVARNKVAPNKHIVEVGADFYGPGYVDFYDQNGDMVELVFIGNSNSTLKDLQDLTGIGGQGKFGGITVNKSISTATVILQKSLTINSGSASSLQGNVTVKKGILDTDSCFVQAGDNANILKIDSITGLYIASDDLHSLNGFEQYIIHPNSTIKYYRDGDYEMTKGWKTFDGNLGNIIIAGDGEKYFGDSVVNRFIAGDLTIEQGGNLNADNDTITLDRMVNILGTFSTDNKNSVVTFNNLVNVASTGRWYATTNDWFEFKNGLTASKDAEFNGGSGFYTFSTNDQSIFLDDTIPIMVIDAITLLNEDSLACENIIGSGSLVNQYYLDITGENISCNLILDSLNNKVIYSNENPLISPNTYEILEFKGSGTATLEGDVLVNRNFIKNNNGYISLFNFNLTLDTAAIFTFDNPSYQKMIVTGGTGKFVLKSASADRFIRVFPVGTITDTIVYTPFEITGMGNYPGNVKFISVNAVAGLHPGMESASGIRKYWSISTDILPTDNIEADLIFSYSDSEADNEETLRVRYWTGDEPWMEPTIWNLDSTSNQITITGANNLDADWTAGDSTAITSKVNNLVFTPASGFLNNPVGVTITSSTPDVKIYYLMGRAIPEVTDSLYSEPLNVDSSLVITAIAFKDGWQNSDTISAVYTFMADTVEFSVPSGSYSMAQDIILTCGTTGAEIRYTTDGSEPDATSAVYGGAISITNTTTIMAKAFKENYLPSVVSEAVYTIVITVVQESENKFKLEAYPIPARDFINIAVNGISSDMVQLSILNSAGMVVMKKQIPANDVANVAIRNLKPGEYIILLNMDTARTTRKFVKL